MNDESKRLQMAQWILERNLQWIAAAEAKTGVIVTLDTAMLGGLAAAFSARGPGCGIWSYVIGSAAGAMLVVAIVCAAMSVLPRVTGPNSSFIFFGRIVAINTADYVRKFRDAATGDVLDDCLSQVHRNAEIACSKFSWVRVSMIWSFVAVMPWVVALGLFVRR